MIDQFLKSSAHSYCLYLYLVAEFSKLFISLIFFCCISLPRYSPKPSSPACCAGRGSDPQPQVLRSQTPVAAVKQNSATELPRAIFAMPWSNLMC